MKCPVNIICLNHPKTTTANLSPESGFGSPQNYFSVRVTGSLWTAFPLNFILGLSVENVIYYNLQMILVMGGTEITFTYPAYANIY